MKQIRKNWQYVSLFVLILFTLLAQVKSYGSLEEKVRRDEQAVVELTDKIGLLTEALNETNIELGMIRGYIEAKKEYNGADITR